MKKRNLALGVGALGATAAAVTGGVCYKIACVSRKKDPVETEPRKLMRAELRKKNNAYLFEHNPEDLEIISPDKLRLKAWFVPKENSKRFVICVHGYNCNGPDECGHLFPFYHYEMNCNYLLPDLRGHGRSDGKLIGYGSWDSKDIKLWIDYLVERFGEDIEIILHGISMGAATVMLVNNTSPQSQVKVVIEDCGFTNAMDEVRETIKSMKLKHTSGAIVNIANLYCKAISKYDLRKDASPLDTMKNAKNPVMFIHGDEDTLVPYEMCGQLYEACPTEKEMFTVKGAAHAFSYYGAKKEYDARVKAFAEKFLSKE